MRELALLIEAGSGPEGGGGAATPLPAVQVREAAGSGVAELARALGAHLVLCGYGEQGERLLAGLTARGGRALPAAASAARRLPDHAPELAGFGGDLLVIPAARVATAPAALAALREVHAAEGNAATILEPEPSCAPGGTAIERDELGRVTGLVAAGELAGAGGGTPSDLAMVFHAPSLISVLKSRPAGSDAGGLTCAVRWLRAAGRPVGALRAPLPGICPRCSDEPRVSAATGVLLVNRRACLAVERPGFNSGQLVCYPRRHLTCALSLVPAEWEDLAALMREGARLARRLYDFDALNIGFGSGVGMHLAFQLIPRWTGDLNFLPLVSGFKAVPEAPEDAWRRYREVLE